MSDSVGEFRICDNNPDARLSRPLAPSTHTAHLRGPPIRWLTPRLTPSPDRVFVHALSTVKRIPKTGAMRPPPVERLRLYGLYKQAMEGDVDGVMERPTSAGLGLRGDDLQREIEKWDAWNAQRGLTKMEAKRRYIETLIATMHKYATTG